MPGSVSCLPKVCFITNTFLHLFHKLCYTTTCIRSYIIFIQYVTNFKTPLHDVHLHHRKNFFIYSWCSMLLIEWRNGYFKLCWSIIWNKLFRNICNLCSYLLVLHNLWQAFSQQAVTLSLITKKEMYACTKVKQFTINTKLEDNTTYLQNHYTSGMILCHFN